KVAKELGVEALITGRVIQRGDDLSVSVELVDAREDKQLWGERYSRKLADITSIQREIANAVSGKLRGGLTSEDKTRLNKPSATNSEAYQLYLKGRYHANQGTAAGLKKSIDYFQQATEKDPAMLWLTRVWPTPTPIWEADGCTFLPAKAFRRRRRRQ